ncbi:Ubiquinone biosynthesis accessory factor UbiK [Anaerolineae bacterium]|nr:Ubiquinone biosynthesis accessory factor UbiK [Anaerolineae bacterium]
MLDSKIIDDISRRISGLIAESPVADLEKNLKPLLQSAFAKLDLVTREEFDVQTQVLQRTREQLTALEARLEALEETPTDQA